MAAVTVELAAYQAERALSKQQRDDQPRRLVTDADGHLLAGVINGEGRAWYRRPLAAHISVSGTGTGHGAVMAACNGTRELGEGGDITDLSRAHRIEPTRRCQRPGCRQAWPTTITGDPR